MARQDASLRWYRELSPGLASPENHRWPSFQRLMPFLDRVSEVFTTGIGSNRTKSVVNSVYFVLQRCVVRAAVCVQCSTGQRQVGSRLHVGYRTIGYVINSRSKLNLSSITLLLSVVIVALSAKTAELSDRSTYPIVMSPVGSPSPSQRLGR